jgi:EamA domain-containing membrane protein RarD
VQFVIALVVYHEPLGGRGPSFALIWVGLALYTADNLWAQRRK